jgi:hypothetical protein
VRDDRQAEDVSQAELGEQVRQALPIARELLMTGMDTRHATEDDVSIRVDELIGHSGTDNDHLGDKEGELLGPGVPCPPATSSSRLTFPPGFESDIEEGTEE